MEVVAYIDSPAAILCDLETGQHETIGIDSPVAQEFQLLVSDPPENG